MQLMNSIRNFRTMIQNFTIFLLLSTALFASISTKVIQNNADQLIIQVDINATSEADIQPKTFIVGFPTDELPVTRIQFLNKSELSFTPLQNSKGDFDWIKNNYLPWTLKSKLSKGFALTFLYLIRLPRASDMLWMTSARG